MQTLLDFLGVPDRPSKKFNCLNCGKWLQFDTGVWESGHPTAWAFCSPRRGGCGKTWCPDLHDMTTAKVYDLGSTLSGSDKDVPLCVSGTCAKKRARIAAIIEEFSERPGGAKAWEFYADLEERSRKGSMNWGRQEALWLLRVRGYFKVVIPAAKRASQASTGATEAAPVRAMTVEEMLASAMSRTAGKVKTAPAADLAFEAQLAALDEVSP